jgi:GH15 family glucan-1,4-alpha-glucosidase
LRERRRPRHNVFEEHAVNTLDLGFVGNSTIGALIDAAGEVVWACLPGFEGDPVFCSLLRERKAAADFGFFAIEVLDFDRSEQHYLTNTAILVTRLYDRHGGGVEITDFAPRFMQYGRMFCPMALVRMIARIAGNPRIRVRIRPAYDHGAHRQSITYGSHHIRYVAPGLVFRITTDASITAIAQETPFYVDRPVTLLLGPDETVQSSVVEVGRKFFEETAAYWHEWVRQLSIPFEWQDAVIRAAITLQLNACEDTGAIIAALTTSIPEAADSGRNWDYRYCWLRDSYFVINSLNRLGATDTMERFLRYILNITAAAESSHLQPVYRINGFANIEERAVASLPGYRGMGPVRVGNEAYRQVQHDAYGSAILAATHVFFDERLVRSGGELLFPQLEQLGERAFACYDKPDAGIWELRGSVAVHTFSSVICWAGCDRLARIAVRLQLVERARFWRERADQMHRAICGRAWNPRLKSFVSKFDGNSLDASLLLLNELGFLAADDPRFASTVDAIAKELLVNGFMFRYTEPDDFGVPANAFIVCTFWYIYALAALGRGAEARPLFEKLLACRNRHGLLAEHIDPRTHEQWGNFVQTYSMVGLINSAIRLSMRWDQAF